MLLQIALALLLVVASGLLVCVELALEEARTNRLQQLADDGNPGAATALGIKADPDRSLPAVRMLITLMMVITGVLAGAQIATALTGLLRLIPAIAPFASVLAYLLVIVGLTYVMLVLGQLAPRRVATQSAEAIAAGSAPLVGALARLSQPLLVVLEGSTALALALIGRSAARESEVTEEDIRHIVHEGTQEGVVEPQEEQIIAGVFQLGARTVRQIMTPRVDVSMLDANAKLRDVMNEVIELNYSRFPVYNQYPDNIVGIVHVRDMLQLARRTGEDTLVREAMAPPLIVSERTRALLLLSTFRRHQRHMAIVVSDFDSIEGVVTLEDVLEEIVGDILDEHDEIDPQAVTTREDGSFLMNGSLPIDMLKAYLDVEMLPDEERNQYDTLAGFVLNQTGRIPQTGEMFTWDGWRFEVVDMDGLRIDKLLVEPLPPADAVPADDAAESALASATAPDEQPQTVRGDRSSQ